MRQVKKLVLICTACLATGSTTEGGDPRTHQDDLLLEMAAARLLAVLTDVTLWRSFPAGKINKRA